MVPAQLVNHPVLRSPPSQVPDFATHVIGMGGMCINARGEVLLVKELKAATTTSQARCRANYFWRCRLGGGRGAVTRKGCWMSNR